LVNRVGDVGFALGIMLVFVTFGSVAFLNVVGSAPPPELTGKIATTISLLLFVGAVGKSAQIPLYVWLPDAMEGPTPVSALIHAATMVTAGVYMVARTHLVFQFSGQALTVVAAIGTVTALFAASMALVQTDIKRVLAYSTISQLGYMFLGAGAGAYAAGIFHLTTHAFFKALLFLGAGSIMHALSGELDIRKMGGLRKKLPVTFWVFLIGGLAIAGVPGLAGFFSKDEILFRAYVADQKLLWVLALITAGLTAFYIFRVIFLVFFGESRVDKKVAHHVHESPRVMTIPMIVLALLSVIGGYIGIPKLLGGNNWIEGFLDGSLGWTLPHAAPPNYGGHDFELPLMIASVVVGLIGIGIAYLMYVARKDWPERIVGQARWLYRLLVKKYFVDEIYAAIIVNPLRSLGNWFADVVDPKGIDRAVTGVAGLLALGGRGLQALQTGLARTYLWAVLAGAVLLLVFVVSR
jgi:NADH-quinone oxidoreductase subunit L